MSKIMTVDILSSIKGAKESETVNKLFEAIKKANSSSSTSFQRASYVVSVDALREDVVVEASKLEKELIIENFPEKKNNYLVVAKVIKE